MSWSGVVKFFTGFVLAIAVLFFAGVSTTRYLITRFTTPPPRPTFPNDPSPAPPEAARPQSTTPAEPPPATPLTEAVQPTPTPSATPAIPPGAYEAQVTQPIGLIVRQEPNQDAEQIGGIGYDEQVVVLEESSDGAWIKVRLSGSNLEGWVKSGNTERLN
ncbi:SH3 domain-containing protein [Oculatella sp. FACHB-28]|uniref:SH3 domain-containing protein n=1 Tax=Oculatella sp. FACHB-28 TaxID=2692845 RepID=UPI00168A0966|nr:SH3 domain-containing protein [Oculatella sp. FACHB-28]MBD2060423.1 SH3 domain-containing protein [Oculatella sp. FACHB-28]